MMEEDAEFEDDPVYQVIKLFNAGVLVPPQVTAKIEQLTGPENDEISEFIKKLENDKRKEIAQLTNELEQERKRRIKAEKKLVKLNLLNQVSKDAQHRILEKLTCDVNAEVSKRLAAEEKLNKLVEFITFVNGEVGKLITCLVSLTTKNVSTLNILNIGPFGDEGEAEEFLEMLKDLSRQFEKDATTNDLLEKANSFSIFRNKQSPLEEVVVEKTHIKKVPNLQTRNVTTDNVQKLDSFVPSKTTTSTTSTIIPPPNVVLDSDLADLIGVFSPGSQQQLEFKKHKKRSKNNLSILIKSESSLDLVSFNKKHGVDHSKRHWGHYCLCGIKQANKYNLNFHIKYFTGERKFKCSMCTKSFITRSHLKAHMFNSHKIIDLCGKFTCTRCTQEFESRKELSVHQKTSCSRDISKNVDRGDMGNILITTNPSGERVTAVDKGFDENRGNETPSESGKEDFICGKVFSWKSASNQSGHNNNFKNAFCCGICSKCYKYPSSLRKHYQTAHKLGYEFEQKKYGCTVCGEFFESMGKARSHRRIAHADGENILLSSISKFKEPQPSKDCTEMTITPVKLTATTNATNPADDEVICID